MPPLKGLPPMNKLRIHSPEFKASVAMEAIRGLLVNCMSSLGGEPQPVPHLVGPLMHCQIHRAAGLEYQAIR